MASSLVRGKYVICKVTGPTSAQVITDGAVFQEDGEIKEVGVYDDLRARNPGTEVIGSSRHVVMPGLVNDHFHVGLTPFQMGSPDLHLDLWALARLGARSIDPYLDQLYGAVQMIETGTTTVQAIHAAGRGSSKLLEPEVVDGVLGAYQKAGMRVSYAPSVADQNMLLSGTRGGEDELAAQLPDDLAQRFRAFMADGWYLPVEETLGRLEDICAKYAGGQHQRVKVAMAPSNVNRCTNELLLGIKMIATKYSIPTHIHLQESPYQKFYGLRVWNKTPLQHLHDLELMGPDLTCGHSVWATDEDVELMAATGTNVCHNASSNLRLQSGIAPVNTFLAKGIKVAIGSDEAGINDDKDLFQEMRLVLKLHRIPGVENVPPTSYQVLQMATANGAYATGFGDQVGTLEPGKRADLILVDLKNIEEPFLDPLVSVVDAVVHRGRGIDVETVMIDGEVVMRDRRLTRVDKEALYKELKLALDRPLTPSEKEKRDLSQQLEPYFTAFHSGTMPDSFEPHYGYNARR